MLVPALSNLTPRRRRPARDRASLSRHSSLKKCRPSANSLVLSSPDRPQPADKASRLAECENDPPDEWQDRRRKPSGQRFHPRSYPTQFVRVCSRRPAWHRLPMETYAQLLLASMEDSQPFVLACRVITRARNQRKALQDLETSSSHRSIFSQALGESWSMIPLDIDPPTHGIFLTLLNPLFSPRRVRDLLPMRRQ